MADRALEHLPGGTTGPERRMLGQLAARVRVGQIVEIGSYVGGSTIYLARGAKQWGTRVYSVDPHTEGTVSEFLSNLAGFDCMGVVVPMVMKSEDAAKTFLEPIGLLFIDGLHDYENCKGDFIGWQSKLVQGSGVVVFHDCWSVGVCRTIAEMFGSGQFSNVHLCQGLLWATKCPPSWGQRVAYRLFSMALLTVAYIKAWLLSNATIRKLERKFQLQRKLKSLIPRV